ncbi:Hint domain-containing protein [Roseovarius arcticus]|uniref:Hint domain-containing protein n=1 Tax=Roseovarius arcticus TaxID=2547404 RepID=UPI001BB215E4|nr:Hint domain-containing protein [Roseovarius arcticus]
MPVQTIYALGQSKITVSGGSQLSGVTQGDGSHLAGRTITLNSNAWTPVSINDDDANFEDNDTSQTLQTAQTFDGQSYAQGRVVEAEYQVTVRDPSGTEYQLIGFNINEGGGGPAYATVEGLAFVGGVGGFPPQGVPLTVISTSEGSSRPVAALATPPCFTAGTQIDTPSGAVQIETLSAGDLVKTADHGAQQIRWIGRTYLPAAVLASHPEFRPIRIMRDAFGPGLPYRDTALSPQHRILISDWRAMLFFGEDEVLVPAHKLANDASIRPNHTAIGVTYYHLAFDRHEVIWGDGLLSESYLIGGKGASETRDEMQVLGIAVAAQDAMLAARVCVTDRRGRLLRPA